MLIPIEAEQVCIGQMLIDHRIATTAAQLLKPEHFGDPACREAYEAVLAVWRKGKGVDLVTVSHELRKRQKTYDPAAFHVLAKYTTPVASTIHFEYHAEIVREHYASRVLREAADGIITGTASGTDPLSLIAPANEALSRAAMADEGRDVKAGERAFDLMNAATKPNPIYMGIANLDSKVWMLPGNVVNIRADAGVGKTALVLSAVLNLLPTVKTWFVSLEMSEDELVTRALCQLAQVDIDSALIDRLTDAERQRMADAASKYANILNDLEIDDSGSMFTDEFMAKAEHHVKNGTGLIVIDYAQLMSADRKLYSTQAAELEAISKCIRATAKKLNVPIIVIVHVNKLGDDHGSSQFEKDAHVRLHLSRELGADMMSVQILKNRNGRPGSVEVPCSMRWGMVGRISPPMWADGAVPSPLPKPKMPPPRDFNETDEFNPF